MIINAENWGSELVCVSYQWVRNTEHQGTYRGTVRAYMQRQIAILVPLQMRTPTPLRLGDDDRPVQLMLIQQMS